MPGPGGVYQLYVGYRTNNRVIRYDSGFATQMELGSLGTSPGQSHGISGMAIMDSEAAVFFSDSSNARVQKLSQIAQPSNARAVILAGGGASTSTFTNDLWNATESSANFAYRCLLQQGFTKDRIRYLSSNTQLSFDPEGQPGAVFADATLSSLQTALESWAPGADSLVVYLVDHGGSEQFRLNATQTVSASSLALWLATADAGISGRITVIYDACNSGSFVAPLAGPNRTIISSTLPAETAKFISTGTISFSSFFWEQVFNGRNPLGAAFTTAQQAMQPYQTAQIDADGNGTPNQASDLSAVALLEKIGNGTDFNLDRPDIGSAQVLVGGVPSGTLATGNTATIRALNVVDPSVGGAINRVWALLRPPNYVPPSQDNPVTNLPTVELSRIGATNDFESTYAGFTTPGTYQIVLYALDSNTETSLPEVLSFVVQNPQRRKAIVVAGGAQADALWPATQNNAGRAYEALKVQGYADQDIAFRSPVTFNAGVDGYPSLANLGYLIQTWARDAGDLTLYLVGGGGAGTFRIGPTETLTAEQLHTWLDTLQNDLQAAQLGIVTVVYDADESGSFISSLKPPTGKQRAVLCSTLGGEPARFLSGGDISFSSYFWTRVLNGANVRTAFNHAGVAIRFAGQGQRPILDDNGNGIGGETLDSLLANTYTIGMGVQLAGDDPVIGSLTVTPTTLSGGATTATIRVDDVTTTGQISQVLATVSPPDGSSSAPTVVPLVETPPNSKSWRADYSGFSGYGFHAVSVVAIDVEKHVSIPVSTQVHQRDGATGDAYEVDDTLAQASYIDEGVVQTHNFHDAGDLDWIRFSAGANDTLTIETFGLGPGANTEIEVFHSNGTPIAGTLTDDGFPDPANQFGEQFPFRPSQYGLPSGEYYLRVQFSTMSPASPKFGPDTYFKVRVFREIGPASAKFSVVVQDPSGAGIPNVAGGIPVASLTLQLKDSTCPEPPVENEPCPYAAGRKTANTNPSSYYFPSVPVNNTYTMTVSAAGFVTRVIDVIVPAGAEVDTNFSPVGTVVLQPIAAGASPQIEVLPTSLEFGNIGAGLSQTASLVVKNVGSGTLSGSASLPAGPFSIVGTAAYSLAPNATQTITVRFAPTSTSSETPSAYVTFTTGGADRVVPVSGFTGIIWMDFGWGGQALGTFDKPYTTFTQSVPAVAAGGLIRIKTSTSMSAVTLSKAMRLEAYGGIVRIGGTGSGLAPAWRDPDPSTEDPFAAVLRQLLTGGAGSAPAETVTPQPGVDSSASPDGGTNQDPASNAIHEGFVFETVIPYTRLGDGRLSASEDVPLAVRLRAESNIDPATLWQDIGAEEATQSLVTWQHAEGDDDADLWVLFRPLQFWAQGDQIQVATGATTQEGDAVATPTQTFVVQSAADAGGNLIQTHGPDGDGGQIAIVIAGSALTPGLPGGLDQPYTIGPERVFDRPQLVWLPLPEGSANAALQLYYYHAYGDDPGWYPAQNVIGWLAQAPQQFVEFNGTRYLGLHVRHAGIVQFAPSAPR